MGEAPNLAGGTAGLLLHYVPLPEIQRIRNSIRNPFLLSRILANIFRLNTLYMIRYTNSGHPGTSLSCTDIITWLFTQEMENPNEKDADPSDIFFSSKGHDVPALYALLIGLEKLPFEMIHKLRRLDGLPGHPDIKIPYIMANTGSLGMGISKARGMAQAKRFQGKHGRVFVLTGDGELQEGQIWESLQPTANRKFSEIIAIVDHNKAQSEKPVKETSDLGRIEDKFRSFGWEVARADGHDFNALEKVFAHFKSIKDKPKILIADTLKGKGVSFMEKFDADGNYKFHSGAPTYEEFQQALEELSAKINADLRLAGLLPLRFESRGMQPSIMPSRVQRLITAYGDELVKIARERKDMVALDADLFPDTGLTQFRNEFPERLIQCGIAEQDMVSMAGGLALKGMLPVVHSFECFLSTRANEHFYNNATEKTKIIYMGCLAGLLPGMPGHSHQSLRGISVLGSIPGLILIQPGSERETRMAIRWAVEKNKESTYIRFVSVASEAPYEFPKNYELEVGRGAFLREGSDVIIIAYGPVMLTEAVRAAELLTKNDISTAVLDLPWLNRIDGKWLFDVLKPYQLAVTIDDHYVALGQGIQIAGALSYVGSSHPKLVSWGIENIPACGHNGEVIQHHGLDFQSLAERIKKELHEKII